MATPLPIDLDTIVVAPSDLAVALATVQATAATFCERSTAVDAASRQE
jgi:hypothetical protein